MHARAFAAAVPTVAPRQSIDARNKATIGLRAIAIRPSSSIVIGPLRSVYEAGAEYTTSANRNTELPRHGGRGRGCGLKEWSRQVLCRAED